MFKPQLLPNNKVGEPADWEERIEYPKDWMFSNKLDGARVELFADGTGKGRSLKPLPSIHVNAMCKEIALALQMHPDTIMECEFYSPDMNFSELMHFFKTEDVTSAETVDKYEKLWIKTEGDPDLGWKYPGRSVEWLTTWHDSLKLYAFGVINTEYYSIKFSDRYTILETLVEKYNKAVEGTVPEPYLKIIRQNSFTEIDQLYQAYDQALLDGHEGVVVMHKDSTYKCGRVTLNAKQAFKIKNDDIEYDGQIISVEESTIAREGSDRTVNELGRSVTSKLKKDRIPSGMAKGFKVRMDDGNELTVSLKGYDHTARKELLENASEYIGHWIRFTGMAPVKIGGCPRQAHYEKGNLRDEK